LLRGENPLAVAELLETIDEDTGKRGGGVSKRCTALRDAASGVVFEPELERKLVRSLWGEK
jgi:hypothetical protein